MMNDCSESADFHLDFRVSGSHITMEVLKIVLIVIFMENATLMTTSNKLPHLILIA